VPFLTFDAGNEHGYRPAAACPVIENNLKGLHIAFNWPGTGWCVGKIARASRKLDKDGYNTTVHYQESSHRHTLRSQDEKGVTVYCPSGEGPAGAWLLLQPPA
jgi:hypothetical protein